MFRSREKMETYCKAILNLLIFAAGILLLVYLLPKVLVYFTPFVIGGLVAVISNPLVRFFERKLKVRRKTGTAVVIITVMALVIILGYLLISWVAKQTTGFLAEWPVIWEEIQNEFYGMGEQLGHLLGYLPEEAKDTLLLFQDHINRWLGEMVTTISVPTFAAVGDFFKNLPSIVVGIVMCLLSAYFFIAEREYLGKTLLRIFPESITEKWRLIVHSIKGALGGYLKAQLKIEIWVYLLMTAGFFLLKVEYAVLIAFGIAVLDFLPVFGTGTVLIPWAVVKLLNGEYLHGVGLMIIWSVGQLVRQMIQPKIMGDTIGISPIPTLFLLYIGFQTAGVMGMIAALPIGVIGMNLYRAGAFETTQKSLKILFDGLNRFRRLEGIHLAKEK